MMGKTLGWLGLTVGKPQGRSLCVWGVASGSAASHLDPGSSGMVEFSEESHVLSIDRSPLPYLQATVEPSISRPSFLFPQLLARDRIKTELAITRPMTKRETRLVETKKKPPGGAPPRAVAKKSEPLPRGRPRG